MASMASFCALKALALNKIDESKKADESMQKLTATMEGNASTQMVTRFSEMLGFTKSQSLTFPTSDPSPKLQKSPLSGSKSNLTDYVYINHSI
jgi:hypothetical protein